MGNRTLIVVWLVALLGVGAYVYYIYGGKGSQVAGLIPGSGLVSGEGATPTTDLMGNLNSKTMIALSIRPNGFDPLASYAREFLTKAKGTQMAKKSGVSTQIDSALEKGFFSLAESSAQDEESARAIRIANQVWSDIAEIMLVVSKEKAREDLPIPVIGIAAKFNSKDSASKFRTFVDKGILLGKPNIKEEEFSFSKGAADGEYGFEIFPKELPTSVEGSVRFENDSLRITVGSKEVKFFDALGDDLFVKSHSFEGLLSPQAGAPAYLVYVDGKPLKDFAASLESMMGMPEGTDGPFSSYVKMLDGVQGAAVSGSFDKGIVAEACVRGDLAKLNMKDIGGARTSKDIFPHLIGASTVFAGRFGVPYFKYLVESQTSELPPEVAESFKPALKFIDDIGAEELGLVVNAPAGSPFPEGSIYISTKDGTNLLQRFKSGVEALGVSTGQPLPVDITESKSQKGHAQLQVMNPSGMPLVGSVVGGSTLMFSMSEGAINAAEEKISKGETTLDNFTLTSGEPFPSLKDVSGVYLVNLAPAMDTIRGFAPMMLAAQDPSMVSGDPKDLDEVLDLLAGSAVIMHGTNVKGSDVLCQTTGAVRLKTKS